MESTPPASVDRRPDGMWDGCANDPISVEDAHAVAANWADTTQLSNALDAAACVIERREDALRQIAESDHVINMLGTGCVGASLTVHRARDGEFVPVEKVNCPACFAKEALDAAS